MRSKNYFKNFYNFIEWLDIFSKYVNCKFETNFSPSVKFLSLGKLETFSEEIMQLRRLIKVSNESLPICFGDLSFKVKFSILSS